MQKIQSNLPNLKVSGSKLVNENNQPVALHGVSLGWHNWWPRFYNEGAINELTNVWRCDVVRAAIGVEPKEGYINEPEKGWQRLTSVINACIKNNKYVIIDWHSHNVKKEEALMFFEKVAKTYGKYPNIVYEIFNEPVNQSWKNLKNYSSFIIETIRKYDPDNIILVGSPHWDQDIHLVLADPLPNYKNIMYTFHFYAGTHKEDLRERFENTLKSSLPVFVSECGGMDATGDGDLNYDEWNAWTNLMDKYKISWVAWSLADKNETCSMLYPSASSDGNWKDDDIKEWGKIIKQKLLEYKK